MRGAPAGAGGPRAAAWAVAVGRAEGAAAVRCAFKDRKVERCLKRSLVKNSDKRGGPAMRITILNSHIRQSRIDIPHTPHTPVATLTPLEPRLQSVQEYRYSWTLRGKRVLATQVASSEE